MFYFLTQSVNRKYTPRMASGAPTCLRSFVRGDILVIWVDYPLDVEFGDEKTGGTVQL